MMFILRLRSRVWNSTLVEDYPQVIFSYEFVAGSDPVFEKVSVICVRGRIYIYKKSGKVHI